MPKKALLFFALFMAGGLLLSAGAWLFPAVDVPTVAPGEVIEPATAERIEALRLERDVREAVRRGNLRGLRWGLTFAQIVLALLLLDQLYHLLLGRPGPLQRAFDRRWGRALRGRDRERRDA